MSPHNAHPPGQHVNNDRQTKNETTDSLPDKAGKNTASAKKPVNSIFNRLFCGLEQDYRMLTGLDNFSASSVMYFLKPSSVFHWSLSSPQTAKK